MARSYDGEFLDFAGACSTKLRRTAYLMCGDWERAHDLVQEALIRLYLAWPRIEKGPGLAAYARRSVVTIALDQARKRSASELPDNDLDPGRVDDPAVGVVERVTVLAALAGLPPRQRACVVLRYYEDLSVSEVAVTLGCREGTVKSQTARGLASLRARLQDLTLSEGAAS